MAPLKILICGGGIAGPALAFWLSRLGHSVTIIERFDSLRASGQQLDLRGPGITVMKRMGLEDLFREHSIKETGMQLVDDDGKQKAFFPTNDSGKGLQSFSTEYEIMRGDLCRMLYSVTQDRVKYVFGKQVESFAQDDNTVRVTLSDGKEEQYDLLVGADGQGSRTRKMMLGANAPNPFHFLNMYIAYFTIPREDGDEYISTFYNIPGKRFVFSRRHSPDTIQAYLGYCKASEKLERARDGGVQQEKKAWAELFSDAAWKTPRFIRDMHNAGVANDFYYQKVGQIKLDSWSHGRVVLLGDAAYCPSPATGMGTTSALTGAYVLAGEIGRYCNGLDSCDVGDPLLFALQEYDRKFRPFMTQVQTLAPGMPNAVAPETKWGIFVMHFVLWLATLLGIDAAAQWFLREKTTWDLPHYEDLDVSSQGGTGAAEGKQSL